MKVKYPVTVVQRSCLTGQAVWVYRGQSMNAARVAYCRACRREKERVRRWPEVVERRRRNIARMLDELLADLPINVTLMPEQQAAVRQLRNFERQAPGCHRSFYEHIVEERRHKPRSKKSLRHVMFNQA